MTQIKIVSEGVDFYDLQLDLDEGEHLALDESLRTAVLISLLTERRCEPSEAPDPTDLGGFWGDTYPDVPGDAAGSRLWCLKGAKVLPETLARATGYVREALQWMVDDGIVASQDAIAVELAFTGPSLLSGTVTIARPDKPLDPWVVAWQATL